MQAKARQEEHEMIMQPIRRTHSTPLAVEVKPPSRLQFKPSI